MPTNPAAVRSEVEPLDSPENAPQQAVGPYLRAVRRHWRFVLVVTVLTAAVAISTVLREGKTYQASASVLITPLPQTDPNFIGIGVVTDTGEPARTVQTAAALINSAEAASATAAAMGHGSTTEAVQKAVNVTPLGQSNVLSITATGSSPSDAARLANEFAKAAVAARGTVVQHNISTELTVLEARVGALSSGVQSTTSEQADLSARIGELRAARASGGDPTLSVSQAAQPPTSASGASRSLIALLSLLGGFALASIGALGLEFFNRAVRDEDELTTLFPAAVLATIPQVRHRGDRPLAPWQLPPVAIEQVRMLRVQLELAVRSPVIMVTSAGTGDGKTTIAASLAAAFAEGGQNVILMDLDLRRPSLAEVLGVETHAQPSFGIDDPDDILDRLVAIPKLPNVKLLPFPAASGTNIDEVMARLPEVIAHAQRTAGCLIIDTAPVGQVSETLRIAPMCDPVIFVARPRHTDRRRLVLARDLLVRAGTPPAGLVLVGQPLPKGHGDYYGYAQPVAGGVNGDEQSRGEARVLALGREHPDA
jgi:Mrp family chromosome partitioning ATPase